MRLLLLSGIFWLLTDCSSRDRYDVRRYLDAREEDQALTSIVCHIADAPPYTRMEDRFGIEHREYYSRLAGKYRIEKYFIDEHSIHYFYVIRPAPKPGEARGVGGHFRMKENFVLGEFREEFVTPLLPEAEIQGRCAFLFEEMVKGTLKKYLDMPSFVQWPNEISYYDTISYSWRLKSPPN